MKVVTVYSSHGQLSVESTTGVVLDASLYEDGDAARIAPIERFDAQEFMTKYKVTELPDSIDILDIGYWYRPSVGDLQYEPPEESWREEFRNPKNNSYGQRHNDG